MCIACYWIGRKYYPVPYPLSRMLIYLFVAILLYFVSEWLRPSLEELPSRLLVNTLILGVYGAFIWAIERRGLVRMFFRA